MGKKICVIGSGLAGGFVAAQLAAKGNSVTLIERGGSPEPFHPTDEDWRNDVPKATFTRGTGIGGTSNFWHGGLTILDRADVEGMHGDSQCPKSPILYSELRDYYNQAISIIRGKHEYALDDIESPPNANNNEFVINSDVFRYKGLLYPKTLFSTGSLIEDARKHYGLEVLKHVEVKRLLFSKGGHASSVEGLEGPQQTLRKVDADIFILCAGGLGSPKILLESARLNSNMQDLPIGRFLIDHPTGFVFKAKLRRRMKLEQLFGQSIHGCRLQCGFVLKPDHLHSTNFRNHIVYLRPATSMKDPLIYDFLKRKLVAYRGQYLKPSDLAYLLRHTDLMFDAVNFKFGLFHSTRYVSGMTFLEQLPNDRDRISCNGGRCAVDWNITKEDSLSLEKFLEVYFDSHSDMFESYTVFPQIRQRLDTSGHHSGGCRMAAHRTDGVVDADLRVFGTDNLFVVDGSVIGYSGSANTGLTILALSLKCCDAVGRS